MWFRAAVTSADETEQTGSHQQLNVMYVYCYQHVGENKRISSLTRVLTHNLFLLCFLVQN